MGKLKIAFVLDDTLDTPDGVQQYILTLGTWLTAKGHEVHYLVGATTRTDVPNVHSMSRNVRVKFNGNGMSTPLPASRKKIAGLLEREKFDILHVQIPYSPFMAQRVILAAPASTAIFGTFHIAPNSSLVRHANKALGLMVRRSIKRFDTIVSVSPAAAAFARATIGISTDVVPNVVEAERYASAQAFEFKPALPTIVFVGRLVPRKGCRILLEALAELQSDAYFPKFRAIICGRGPLETELKSYAASEGLDQSVQFAGFVTESDKARYLRTADIAVFPSTGGESFGIVLTEAMAADHPVVLGAANEGYKTVLDAYPDLLVPVSDPVSLATKLRLFLTDETERQKALKWQKTAIRQYDVEAVGPRLVARYNQALRSRTIVR